MPFSQHHISGDADKHAVNTLGKWKKYGNLHNVNQITVIIKLMVP
jgi:hypothetical protein